MILRQGLWRAIIRLFSPKSSHWVVEGLRLMAANGCYLLLMAGVWYGFYRAVSALQTVHIPMPQPVGLLVLFLGIPYFTIWFVYGKKFGTYVEKKPFLKGMVIGLLGIIPNLIYIIYLFMQFARYSFLTEQERINLVVLSVFSAVLPIMSALGVLDSRASKAVLRAYKKRSL